MIKITDKTECCGCGACEQRCPKHCISLLEDSEGFLYPKVDLDSCIDCGVCDNVCPVLTKYDKREPLNVYAAINKSEQIRLESSSGGVFSLLAESVIRDGGVVFGAAFNEKWEVVHVCAETIDRLESLRKSKYVQSKIGETYIQAERFLREGRRVLYVGSPCQIAGLKRFLRKDYKNLLSVDFICHGVPSPKVWRIYLKELLSTQCVDDGRCKMPLTLNDISNISFRDKSYGWKKYGLKVWGVPAISNVDSSTVFKSGIKFEDAPVLFYESFHENIFMRAFLSDITLRPSCYRCPSKSGRSGSDITIADYWNIQNVAPEFDDDKGVGLVLINTEKGVLNYPIENTDYIATSYDDCRRWNGGFKEQLAVPPQRSTFFKRLDKERSVISLIKRVTSESIIIRCKKNVKRILKRVFN